MSAPLKPPLVRGGVTFLAQGIQKLTSQIQARYGLPPAIIRGFPHTVDPAACVVGNPSYILNRPYFWRLKGTQPDTLIATLNVAVGLGGPGKEFGVALYEVASTKDGVIVLGLIQEWIGIAGDSGQVICCRLTVPITAGQKEFAVGLFTNFQHEDTIYAPLVGLDGRIGLGETTTATGFPRSVTIDNATTEGTGIVVSAYTNPIAEARQVVAFPRIQQVGLY